MSGGIAVVPNTGRYGQAGVFFEAFSREPKHHVSKASS